MVDLIDNSRGNGYVATDKQMAEIRRMATKHGPGNASEFVAEMMTKITTENGYGSVGSRVSQNYHGLNQLATPPGLPQNTDEYGYIFFTRPLMRLTYDNLIAERTLMPMMHTDKFSMFRAVRAYLDPVGAKTFYPSGLVDPKNPFITLMTNLCTTMSGWPNPQVDTYSSKAGIYKEQWSMYDGSSKIMGGFTLNATFKNIINDPISYLINTWGTYGSLVYDGTIRPYPEAAVMRYIDYQTRIIRLVLDSNHEYVQKWAACGTAIPTVNNLGSSFDYDISKPVNPELDDVSVTFTCNIAMYNDPIIILEFNRSVAAFNPAMSDRNRDTYMRKLARKEIPLFNYLAYPRVDEKTSEMQWWVPIETYRLMEGGL